MTETDEPVRVVGDEIIADTEKMLIGKVYSVFFELEWQHFRKIDDDKFEIFKLDDTR